jgi:hypothetical protein
MSTMILMSVARFGSLRQAGVVLAQGDSKKSIDFA